MTLLFLLCISRSVYADVLLKSVPIDVAGCYLSAGDQSSEVHSATMISTLLTAASLTGVFSSNQQMIADIAASMVEVGKYPHAIFLQKINSRKLGKGSFALGSFSGGIIIRADKASHSGLLSLLKQIIDHYFTATNTRITWVGKGKFRHQKLTSQNLPEWASWEWISLDKRFIFTIGKGVFDKVISTMQNRQSSLDSLYLYKLAEEHDSDIDRPWIMIYANITKFREHLEPVMGQHFDDVLRAFEAQNLRQWLFTSGFTGRAFISKVYLRWPKKIEMGYLTSKLPPGDKLARVIPPQATSYGVSSTDFSMGVDYLVNTYLESKNPKKREKLVQNYHKVMKRAGLENVHEMLFRHLGPRVIIHDWPKHPLNWPFAKTIVIEHDRDASLGKNWQKILPVWQELLAKITHSDRLKKTHISLSGLLRLQIDKTKDNIWFLHIGPLVLASAGLDDRFLVISHSVPAVRANLQYLKSIE